ncbi:MAG: hypothetical protein ACYCXW_11085, partial [Solirubrobacteraceae bacterium]
MSDEKHRDLSAYLRVLAGEDAAGSLRLDIRWSLGDGGMAQRFIAADRIAWAAELISRVALSADVYVGVALRLPSRGGGKRA